LLFDISVNTIYGMKIQASSILFFILKGRINDLGILQPSWFSKITEKRMELSVEDERRSQGTEGWRYRYVRSWEVEMLHALNPVSVPSL